MLQRIHTWVPNPVLGDMNYEHEFTNDSYIDLGQRHQVPDRVALARGVGRQLRAQTDSAGHNAFGGIAEGHQGEVSARTRWRCPSAVRQATFPVQRRDDKAGRRRVSAGRRHPQQRGGRVHGTSSRCSRRRSTKSAAWR